MDTPADEGVIPEAIPVLELSNTQNTNSDPLAESEEAETEIKKAAGTEVVVTDETPPSADKDANAMEPSQDVQPSTAEPAFQEEVQAVTETPIPKDESMTFAAEVTTEPQLKEEPDIKDAVAVKDELAVFTRNVTFKPGTLGVRFDGVTVVNVTPGLQASDAGVKKGYKVLSFGGISVPDDAPAAKLCEWLQEQLKSPRPVQVQFERPVLEAVFADGTMGLKIKGRKVIDVTPDSQASNAGVQAGCILLGFGGESVPTDKTEEQMAEWLEAQLKAPRPIAVKFEHPSTLL